jgi:hypothetical protein
MEINFAIVEMDSKKFDICTRNTWISCFIMFSKPVKCWKYNFEPLYDGDCTFNINS